MDYSAFFNIETIKDICTILGIVLIPTGWIYNKYQQRILDQYSSKEEKYQKILRALDALLYEDFQHPETQKLVYEFIKDFQTCYLYVPDQVIKAGKEFLASFEELLEGPDANLSAELEEILLDNPEEVTKSLEITTLEGLPEKHKTVYKEYFDDKQRKLYEEFRNIKYPEFIKAIRKDMITKRTTLSNEEYIAHIPSQIKIKRHFRFVGKNIAHLILLLVDAKKENNVSRMRNIMARLINYLRPNFNEINYEIRNNHIFIILGEKRYSIISFLEDFSINEVFGFEKALEIKKTLENL